MGKTGALLVTLRWESWWEKSRRCLASPPLQNLGLSLMELLVYSGQQRRRPPHQRTKKNLVFSKPCSPCSSLRPPPPSVEVFSEEGSLVAQTMTRQPPPPRQHQQQQPPNVEVFLEEDFFARNTAFFLGQNLFLIQNKILFAKSQKYIK